MKKEKVYIVKITFTDPQDKDYISEFEECYDIESVEVLK